MKISNFGLIICLTPAINFIKNNCRILVAFFFTILGLYLRFKRLAGRELWTDEIWQLAQTKGAFKPIWHRINVTDFTSFPGVYLLNYPFVNLFGTDKWAINIPNYIVAFLSFYFLYLICQKYLKTFWGFFVAFLLLCFNGNLIYYSFEFRPYAVLPTLSLGSFYFAGLIVSDWKKLSILKKVLVGLFFIFVIIYHVFGIMIVGLCLLYFLVVEANKRSYKEIIKEMSPFLLPTGILGVLLFIWYVSSTTWNDVQKGNWHPFDYYPNVTNDFVHFVRQVFCNLRGDKSHGQKYLELGIWFSFLLSKNNRFKLIGFFLLMIVLPITVILALAIYEKYWFLDRQFIWVMSLYAFFLAWCWDSIIVYLQEKEKNRDLINLIFRRQQIGSR